MTQTVIIELPAEFQAQLREINEKLDRLTATQPDELLTTQEAADLLRVSPDTIRRRVKEGSLETVRRGRNMRFRKADLLKEGR